MNAVPEISWRARCTELGLDPQEIKAVSGRYDMYKRYTDQHSGDTLNLPRWYKWYRVEKLSEGHAMLTPPANDCSIDSGAMAGGPAVSEQDFLALLQLYRRPTA
jgi:hypothetical protein